MLAQVSQRDRIPQLGGERPRDVADQHLAAVAGRGDPRRPVDLEPQVVVAGDLGLAAVDAHPDAHRPGVPFVARERSLGRHGGTDRGRRRPERHEVRVALRAERDPALRHGRIEDQAPLRVEDRAVGGVAHLGDQLRGALDVREQERDGALGQGARREVGGRHGCSSPLGLA